MLTSLLLASILLAPPPPSPSHVLLQWDDTLNPPSTTYTVRRSTGKCNPNTVLSDLEINITEKRYLDYNISNGQYCYSVIAVLDGMKSPEVPPISVKVTNK